VAAYCGSLVSGAELAASSSNRSKGFCYSLLLLDALPHPDDQRIDETHEDWPQFVLVVFGADDVDGVVRVKEPVKIGRRSLDCDTYATHRGPIGRDTPPRIL